MKSSRDFVRLILFLMVGIGIYCFMGSALASQATEPIPLIEMPPAVARKIWKNIKKLEDSFYVTNEQLISLYQELQNSVRGYDELPPKIEELITIRQKNGQLPQKINQLINANNREKREAYIAQNKKLSAYLDSSAELIDLFAQKKEEIAVLLRPLWMPSMQKELRRARLGFWGRLKEDFADKMNRLYKYFVSVKSK